MGTRSTISAKMSDGQIKTIYCHWDGYLENNGEILFDYYSTQDKIEKLVNLGDISALGNSTDCPEGHSYEDPIEGYTIAYCRERGDEFRILEFQDREEIIENAIQAFNYYWDGEKWYVYEEEWLELDEALKIESD